MAIKMRLEVSGSQSEFAMVGAHVVEETIHDDGRIEGVRREGRKSETYTRQIAPVADMAALQMARAARGWTIVEVA